MHGFNNGLKREVESKTLVLSMHSRFVGKSSTVSKRLVELRSSRSVNRDQETCKKPWKFNVSGVFSFQNLFDLFWQNLTKSDEKKVVNTEGTALFRPVLVKKWGKNQGMTERKKSVWSHLLSSGFAAWCFLFSNYFNQFCLTGTIERFWPNLIIRVLVYPF